MAVNRYNLPANQPIMDTYAPLPFKELLLAGQSMQGQKDALEAQRLELAGKEFGFLPYDFEDAKEKQQWIDTKAAEIAGMYGTDNRKAKQELTKFQLEMNKEFGKFGKIGAMQGNLKTYQDWLAGEEERFKKGDISQDALDKVKSQLYQGYQGVGDGADGRYNSFNTENIAATQDYTEFFDKYGKDIKADVEAYASSRPDLQGYINDFSGALEHMEPEEVERILSRYMAGSDEMMNYYNQGKKYGYTSYEALTNALKGATEKYSYRKESAGASTKTDSTWEYKDKLKKEEIAAMPIEAGTTQTQVKDRLTSLADEKSPWTGLNKNKGLEVFTEDVKRLQSEKLRVQDKMSNIEKQFSKTNDPAAKAALVEEYENLSNTAAGLDSEINKSNEYKESFIKGAFNIDDNYLVENGFESAADYYNTVQQYEKSLSSVEEGRVLMQQSFEELPDKSALGTWKLNNNGTLNFVYDGGAPTEMINAGAGEIRNTIAKYNQMNEAMVNLPISQVANQGKGLKLNSTYDAKDPLKSYNNIKSEINSKKEAANSNASSFIQDRTTVSSYDIIYPEAVSKNPTYQGIQALANSGQGLTFKVKNNQGVIEEYKLPKQSTNWLSPTKKTELKLSGNIRTKEGNMPTFNLVDEEGIVLKTGIMMDASNTTVNKELNKIYSQRAKSTAESFLNPETNEVEYKVDPEVLVGYYATAPSNSNTKKAYSDINKIMEELPTELTTSENDKIHTREMQDVYGKTFYIGLDNVADDNYIIFHKGVTQEQIDNKTYGNRFILVSKDDLIPSVLDYADPNLAEKMYKTK